MPSRRKSSISLRHARLLRSVAIVALFAWANVALAQWRLADGAKTHPEYRGPVPVQADVIFSTRFAREASISTARAFGATRIEWVYTSDAAFVGGLRSVGAHVGMTLNANASLPTGQGYALDFDGTVFIAPWMRSWGARWVTTTHPETQHVMERQLERALELGASSIQFDDPMLQLYVAQSHGGDFNRTTQAGFRDWLRRHPDPDRVRAAGLADFDGDYRAFLVDRHQVANVDDYRRRMKRFPSTALWLEYIQSTVEEYFAALKARLREAEPHPVALSMNVSGLVWPDATHRAYFLTKFADYLMAESDIRETVDMVAQAATARALGLGFAPSIKPIDVARNRVAIAMFYALGGQPLVPWDVYTGPDKRYFGTVAEYGDLYAFARRHARLLDGHETAAIVGIAVDVKAFDLGPVKALVRRLVDRNIPFAFLPVGHSEGRPPNVDSFRALRTIVTLMGRQPLDDVTRGRVESAGVPVMRLDAVREADLDDLRAFVVAPRSAAVRVLPRARPQDPTRLQVHVIDEDRGDPATAIGDCSRRIGIRRSALGHVGDVDARWTSPTGVQRIEPEDGGSHVFFNLPDCPLWGILSLESS